MPPTCVKKDWTYSLSAICWGMKILSPPWFTCMWQAVPEIKLTAHLTPYTPSRMSRPLHDLGWIVRQHQNEIWNSTAFTLHQKRMLQAIADCRTPALGMRELACTDCGSIQYTYNSCRNRNCPKCQSHHREAWISAREQELLPVTYFHAVFTLPDALNPLCRSHPKLLYNCLFQSAWYTINKLGKDPNWIGAQTGMTAVLHTWGSNLSMHPHLHCIVPGGGLSVDGKWRHCRSDGKYLFNRQVMGLIFRARFVKELRKLINKGHIPQQALHSGLFKRLFKQQWITYAKRPFMGPKAVIEYLGRYTHKVAITNYRIVKVTDKQVCFRWKDYRRKGKQKVMTLSTWEFIRRFAMHILPHKFVRIRHYGILANRHKKIKLEACRIALSVEKPMQSNSNRDVNRPLNEVQQLAFCICCCKITIHQILDILPPIRGDPSTKSKLY